MSAPILLDRSSRVVAALKVGGRAGDQLLRSVQNGVVPGHEHRHAVDQAFDGLPLHGAAHDPSEAVVAVTLARLKLPQVPRFIRWGRPVEIQVRDDPGQTLAVAAAAPPRTVSTFTVWRTAEAMTDMVSGQSNVPGRMRHAAAMDERERKDFHFEFTTLRFRCLSEHGSWQGRTSIVPTTGAGRR